MKRRQLKSEGPVPAIMRPIAQTRSTCVKPDNNTRIAINGIHQDRKAGRPTSYRPEFDDLAYELRLAAVPTEAIARIFNTTPNTLYVWLQSHQSFVAAWEDGGDIADARVAHGLYNRATGFSRMIMRQSIDRKTGDLLQWEEETYFPPDTGAGIFWLTNRKRGFWQQSSKTEVSGPGGTALNPPSINVSFVPAKSQLTDADR